MTTGTVTTAGTTGCCGNQAVIFTRRIRMTGRTGVMDRVVSRIYGETRGDRGVMSTGAVGSQGYMAGGNVIDGVRAGVGMTALAVSTAAGTAGG